MVKGIRVGQTGRQVRNSKNVIITFINKEKGYA